MKATIRGAVFDWMLLHESTNENGLTVGLYAVGNDGKLVEYEIRRDGTGEESEMLGGPEYKLETAHTEFLLWRDYYGAHN